MAMMPLGDASDRELLDAAGMWDRLAAWVAGHQARVIAEFASRRPQVDPAADPGHYIFPERHDSGVEVDDTAADELSLALQVAPATATRRMDFACDLAGRFPRTLDRLCAGAVSVAKAHIITDQATQLLEEQVAVLEGRVLPRGQGKTPGKFRRLVRREVARIDADALRRRTVAAVGERKVELIPRPEGMAVLRCELTGPDAVAVYNWLDQHARAAKSAGEARTLDQLRADAFVDLVRERSTTVASRPLVQVLVPVATLAGGDAAGELAGYGPIDPHLARELAAEGTWQRLFTDGRGALMDVDPRRYVPPAALRAFVRARDRTCRFPTCNQPAHRCDIDHTIRRRDGGLTTAGNLGALCRRHHRLKDQPGSAWKLHQNPDGTFRWTDPTGQTYVVPPDPPTNSPSQDQIEARKQEPDHYAPPF